MTMLCPQCRADISETYEPDDHECGIVEGSYCDACDLSVAGWEHPREPMEGDVGIPSRDPCEPDGTPISELSGRAVPEGHPDRQRFENFKRIARSWGHN